MTRTDQILVYCRWLARPVLLFYALPWLMILLTIGTIAQADIGLYQAHKLYFSAWVAWLGPIPVPGTYMTLGLITLSLTAKFLMGSPWRLAKLGTTLTHLGVLILLYGGMATALTQEEGFAVITEGGEAREISDYHDRVLKIFKNDEVIRQIPYGDLQIGRTIEGLPIAVTPTMLCENCSAETLAHKPEVVRHGMAEKIDLIPVLVEKEQELNLSGMMFTVGGAQDADGLYATLEDVPMIPRFEIGNDVYGIQMGRFITPLPFALHLTDFVKEDYPGTETARAYHSDVVVKDGDVEWPVRIEMNTPLRYRGYTFYQSSFGLTPDGRERTVLSAVRNAGWLFPYLASGVIFAGLCVHLFQRFSKRGPA